MSSTEEWNKKWIEGAEQFVADKILNATRAELAVKSIIEEQGLPLVFQVPIYLKDQRGNIVKNYVVDFMDKKHKIVIEVDGGYHKDKQQMLYDKTRQEKIESLGFKVYRITNDEVFYGRTWKFLYLIYHKVGINIFAKDLKKVYL